MNIAKSILILLIVGGTAFTLPQQKEKSEVATFLQNLHQWQLGKGKGKPRPSVSVLNYLGDAVMPLLAGFLIDRELGYTAEDVMVKIDPDKAAPLIFASMPQSDRNVQYYAFRFFIRQIRNKQRFDHTQAMHDAAVRCLEAETDPYSSEQALLALGLTGSSKDFPLLEKYYNDADPKECWRECLRNASEASLAKLGNDKYVNSIAQKLSSTVPPKIDLTMAGIVWQSIQEAGFSGNKRFVPLLCKKLDDPIIETYSPHVIAPSLALEAANALAQIVDKASPDKMVSIEQWRTRCMNFDK